MAPLATETPPASAESTADTAATHDLDTGRRVVLDEWGTRRLELDDDLARRLGQTPWVSVGVDPEPGCWRVSTQQWVGAFTLGDLRIIVRPKIKPENLFFLLEVGLPPEAWQAEAIDYATNDELLPALVSFFARTTETTLARGLFHHYRHESDDLVALRGRIDFARQFRRGGVLVPMACEWDDFTADVDENRCLVAAIRLALRVPDVPHEDRRRLRRLLGALDGVAEPTATAALHRLENIQYTRLNEHYQPALRLAQVIIANCTLQDQHGHTAASAFMLDMNELFERFVTSKLQRQLRGTLEVAAQLRPHLDTDSRVQISPDLTLRRQGHPVGVADLKYKLADSGPSTAGTGGPIARHNDYYQLLAYTTALNLSEGTLIYCADVNREEDNRDGTNGRAGHPNSGRASPSPSTRSTTSSSQQDSDVVKLDASTITVQHTHTRLHTVAIDMSGSPSDIDAQIAALAEHLARSSERSAVT